MVLKALLVLMQDLFSASPLGDSFLRAEFVTISQPILALSSIYYLALLLTTISYFEGVGEVLSYARGVL